MKGKRITNNKNLGKDAFDHAIVIGSSIAGLTAAHILTNHFAQVTVIERDHLPDNSEFRHGVPQARHAHTLKPRGQMILEKQFPGLSAELVAKGAISINPKREIAYFESGGWHSPSYPSTVKTAASSRPLLDSTIYHRLAESSHVNFLQKHEVTGLSFDERQGVVTGVRLHNRVEPQAKDSELQANLVVDASGRGSHAPQWLESLGYAPPQESVINAFPGYETRIYRQPHHFNHDWKSLYIMPEPPHNTRGGVIIPIEDDRWYVSLVGMAHDYPPGDEEGFMAFARSLPSQQLYEAIKDAEPLSKPYGFRNTEDRLRHYDKLSRYLEGFLVFGDAVYTLNPIYALGMTLATMGSLVLDRCIQAVRAASDITGLAQTFQKQLSKIVMGSWKMVTKEDLRWPNAEVALI